MNEKLLSEIWNWLPVFRAVAETEHLPSAAKRLHITTPAISRTIGLLEEHLGHKLFNRTGRALVLNTQGQKLLRAVQQSVNRLDQTIGDIVTHGFEGPVRVSSVGVITDNFVLPALLSLHDKHPELKPRLVMYGTRDANTRLLEGRLDVAFYYEGLTHENLSVEKTGQTSASIYCGRTHTLFDRDDVSFDDLMAHEFSVPAIGDSGRSMDGWPVDIPRKVGMQITLLTTNLEVCKSGQFITVLPDVTAYASWKAGDLRRFPFEVIDPIPIYATYRRDDAQNEVSVAIVDAVLRRIEEIALQLSEMR